MSWYKALNLLFFIANAALLGGAAFFIVSRGYEPGGSFSEYEIVILLMTVVAILLTALGIFLAVLAVWGYSTLRQAAMDHAKKTAEAVAARTMRVKEQGSSSLHRGDYGEAASEEESDATDRSIGG